MRRTWIKLFCDQWLRGSIRKEEINVRAVFADLLAMSGDSAFGDSGIIQLADDVGFTDATISGILNIPLETWLSAKKRLSEHPDPKENRIKIVFLSQGYAIRILKWKKYQSEYNRQREYREPKKEDEKKDGAQQGKVTEQVTNKVTSEVTDQVTDLVTKRRRRRLEGEGEGEGEREREGKKEKESLREGEREPKKKPSPNVKVIIQQTNIKTDEFDFDSYSPEQLKRRKTDLIEQRKEQIALHQNVQYLTDAINKIDEFLKETNK